MLISDVPPTASLDVLSAELATAARDRRLATYLDQPVRIGALSVTAAHPFSVVDVDELVNADSLGAAAPIDGWRYLLEVNQRPVALATVDIDPAGRHRFGGIGTGPAVSSVVYAVHIAEALLQARPGDFQFDARDVPAVHTVVLRVTDRAGEARHSSRSAWRQHCTPHGSTAARRCSRRC